MNKNEISILANTLTWEREGEKNIIIAIQEEKGTARSLVGISVEGKKLFEQGEPQGFRFAYLVEHPIVGVAIVCQGQEKVDGWYDWNFAIDVKTGELRRYCPAY